MMITIDPILLRIINFLVILFRLILRMQITLMAQTIRMQASFQIKPINLWHGQRRMDALGWFESYARYLASSSSGTKWCSYLTPINIASVEICGGHYIYFRTSNTLKSQAQILSRWIIEIGGVSLFNSSNIQFGSIILLFSLYTFDLLILTLLFF